jgi:hypothetical protein
MKFSFPSGDPATINQKIVTALAGRELGKLVNFAMSGDTLVVTISKMGTSVLTFKQKSSKDGLHYSLDSEKIAFAHKIFKDEVKDKLCKVIEGVGGKVLEK